MGTEIKSRSGHTGLRYLRSQHDRERILKVYTDYGSEVFTLQHILLESLPDMTSGEIERWSSAGIIKCVGRTPQTKTSGSVKIWKLDGSVISILNARVV